MPRGLEVEQALHESGMDNEPYLPARQYHPSVGTPLYAVAPPLPNARVMVPRFKARLRPLSDVGLNPKLRVFDLI